MAIFTPLAVRATWAESSVGVSYIVFNLVLEKVVDVQHLIRPSPPIFLEEKSYDMRELRSRVPSKR